MRRLPHFLLALALLLAGGITLNAATSYDISSHSTVPNGTPLTQVATTTAEDSLSFTVSTKARMVEMVNTAAWSYYLVSGTTTKLIPVAANQVVDVPIEVSQTVYFKNTATTGTMSVWVTQ